MSQELINTSVPRGLKPGSKGFCTVAMTSGLAAAWVERLESLSGYRPIYPLGDPQSARNPISFSHWRLSVAGKSRSVLSRVAFYGADYSQRSNRLAVHVLLESAEQAVGGPAWLLSRPGVIRSTWAGEPQQLPAGVALPTGDRRPSSCQAWANAMGDAGWGGILAESFATVPTKPAYVVYAPGTDVLALFEESLSLLPPARRWEVTFNTFFTELPLNLTCAWRGVVAGTPAANEAARLGPRALILDLTKPPSAAAQGAYADAARAGAGPVANTTSAPRLVGGHAVSTAIKREIGDSEDDSIRTQEASEGTAPTSANSTNRKRLVKSNAEYNFNDDVSDLTAISTGPRVYAPPYIKTKGGVPKLVVGSIITLSLVLGAIGGILAMSWRPKEAAFADRPIADAIKSNTAADQTGIIPPTAADASVDHKQQPVPDNPRPPTTPTTPTTESKAGERSSNIGKADTQLVTAGPTQPAAVPATQPLSKAPLASKPTTTIKDYLTAAQDVARKPISDKAETTVPNHLVSNSVSLDLPFSGNKLQVLAIAWPNGEESFKAKTPSFTLLQERNHSDTSRLLIKYSTLNNLGESMTADLMSITISNGKLDIRTVENKDTDKRKSIVQATENVLDNSVFIIGDPDRNEDKPVAICLQPPVQCQAIKIGEDLDLRLAECIDIANVIAAGTDSTWKVTSTASSIECSFDHKVIIGTTPIDTVFKIAVKSKDNVWRFILDAKGPMKHLFELKEKKQHESDKLTNDLAEHTNILTAKNTNLAARQTAKANKSELDTLTADIKNCTQDISVLNAKKAEIDKDLSAVTAEINVFRGLKTTPPQLSIRFKNSVELKRIAIQLPEIN